jgi:FkbM family methyltransferase
MLIKFSQIVNRYGKPKGIIHIGAHLMEERSDYISQGLYNTIWIEANPKVYSNIKFVNDESNDERAFNYAISDEDNKLYEFNITNNGQSSSILKLDKHKIHHPQIHVSDIINIHSKRMDTLLSENNININDYDFLNIDIQGAELLALKGFGNLLNNIKYIYTEINTNTLYEDCALVSEIDEYLSKYEFKRVETSMTEFEWGDALYIKINKK